MRDPRKDEVRRSAPCHTLKPIQVFRIIDWHHGLAEGPSGSTLFDIEVGDIATSEELAEPRFASIIKLYGKSSSPSAL